jgi:ABC-type sugar transport system ATPase subunit
MGIVMASEEIEEMVSIAHRVVTLAGGRITGEVEGSATEIAKVLEGMFAHPGGTADAG